MSENTGMVRLVTSLANEQLAMQLFTLHQVETNFAAIAMSSVNIQVGGDQWPSKLHTEWEDLPRDVRTLWRKRAGILLLEGLEDMQP